MQVLRAFAMCGLSLFGSLVLLVPQSFGQTTQTIRFDAIPNQILGVSPFPIVAQASSGLSVSIASTTPVVCATAGALVTLKSPGSCSVTASQGGGGGYNPATPVTRTFTVSNALSSGSFTAAPGSPFAAGSYPFAAAVGDFNNDGVPDLATADQAGKINVLLGNGSGGFAAAPGSPFPTGTTLAAVSLAVGDFNADGNQDVIVANYFNGSVTVMMGNGTGGLTVLNSISVGGAGSSTSAIAIGDFNGDGTQDFVVTNYQLDNIVVMLGNGAGGFSPASGSPFATGSGPGSVAVADFNADGVEDLAVANVADGTLTIFLGNGSGGFTVASGSPVSVGTLPLSVAAGYFTGNGIADLAVANSGSNNVTVLAGNGSGGFSAVSGSPFAVGASPYSLAVGDFTGSGVQDIVTANYYSNDITLLLGSGSGGFAAAPYSPLAVGNGPSWVVVKDFNRDGIEDLAIANGPDNDVTVLRGLAVGTAPQTITFGAVSHDVMFGDLPFVISANSNSGLTPTFASITPAVCSFSGTTVTILATGTCSILANQAGNGTYGAVSTVTQFVIAPQADDFNADGKPDLVWQNPDQGVVVWYMGGSQGNTYLGSNFLAPSLTGWTVVGVADFNGDGKPDMVWQNPNQGVVVWYMGGTQGKTYLGSTFLAAPVPGWTVVAVGDFNGDGKPDLVWQNPDQGVAVWYMGGSQGNTYLGSNFLTPSVPGWNVVGTADFNGDGKPDLVWQNPSQGVLVWYMGGSQGATYLGSSWLAPVVSGWRVVGAADFNGDGIPDLVWQNQTSQQVVVWYMTGSQGNVYLGSNPLSGNVPGWTTVAP